MPANSAKAKGLTTYLRSLAEAAHLVGDYHTAYEAALAAHNANASLRHKILLARALHFLEEWEEALPLFEQAASDSPLAHIMLGWTHIFLGQWKNRELPILRGEAIHKAALLRLDRRTGWLQPHLAMMNHNLIVAGQNPAVGVHVSMAHKVSMALSVGDFSAVEELIMGDASLLPQQATLLFHWGWWEQAAELFCTMPELPWTPINTGWSSLLAAQHANDQAASIAAAELIATGWSHIQWPSHGDPVRRLGSKRDAHALVLRHRGFPAEADQIQSVSPPAAHPPGALELPRLILS